MNAIHSENREARRAAIAAELAGRSTSALGAVPAGSSGSSDEMPFDVRVARMTASALQTMATKTRTKCTVPEDPNLAHPVGRSRRQKKADQVRLALFDAAARVVGKHGYAGASVARITSLAGVAQGTFYNYFASRQDLLDQLLPAMGEEMLAHIAAAVTGETDELAREERRFRAFFDFLRKRPAFLRILNEAELFAPRGFRRHFDNIAADYRRALERAQGRGALPGFAADEIEPLVILLMAARSYTSLRYAYGMGGRVKPPPESLIRAYMKLLRHGLKGCPA